MIQPGHERRDGVDCSVGDGDDKVVSLVNWKNQPPTVDTIEMMAARASRLSGATARVTVA